MEQKIEENTKNREAVSFWKITNFISLGILVTSIIAYFLIIKDRRVQTVDENAIKKKVRFYGRDISGGHLEEIKTVLYRLGYKNSSDESDWDLLWAHDYPFGKLSSELSNLKKHQKVNHFPGCGYLTNKVHLATTALHSQNYIPKAFRVPEDSDKLLQYSKDNPSLTFVQKDNHHRKIEIKAIKDIDLKSEGTFVQEYISNPLLISGHKFDIGIYTVITSIDPLRVYIYNGEALLRFCPSKYHPFDPKDQDKYIIGDDYLPIWNVPDLDYYYNSLGFGMRESLNAYLESIGKDYSSIWSQIEEAIQLIIQEKVELISESAGKFSRNNNFFEMMRFDFIVDEHLAVYLLEANMSPNLSSQHFPQNRLLYQQVLYNVLGLVGVGEKIYKSSLGFRNLEEKSMIASDKQIAVFPQECNSALCKNSCKEDICQLCKPCLSLETKEFLFEAVYEHFHRGDCKRIFPPKMSQQDGINMNGITLSSLNNYLQILWFQGKCLLDESWC